MQLSVKVRFSVDRNRKRITSVKLQGLELRNFLGTVVDISKAV